MAFESPDNRFRPLPLRRRGQHGFTVEVLQQLLGMDDDSHITATRFDPSRGIFSVYFENPKMPEVPEGQEGPEIKPGMEKEYAKQYADWQKKIVAERKKKEREAKKAEAKAAAEAAAEEEASA